MERLQWYEHAVFPRTLASLDMNHSKGDPETAMEMCRVYTVDKELPGSLTLPPNFETQKVPIEATRSRR